MIRNTPLGNLCIIISGFFLPVLVGPFPGLAEKVHFFQTALIFIMQTIRILVIVKMAPADDLAGLIIHRSSPAGNADPSDVAEVFEAPPPLPAHSRPEPGWEG